jgi:uncharacterized protein (DUF885 family)
MTTNRRESSPDGRRPPHSALRPRQAEPRRESRDIGALLGIGEEMLVDRMRRASASTSAARAAQGELSDRSAGQAAIAKRVAARLERMKAVDAAALSEAARIDLDVVRTAHETAAEGFAFPYGDVATLNQNWSVRNAPYVVTQNTGAFLEIPSLLEEQHTVANKEDADAYLTRLSAYAGQIDGETGRLKSAGSQGVIAPDFILDKALAQIKLAHEGDVAKWPMIASFAKKADPSVATSRRRRRSSRRKNRPGARARRPSSRRIARAQRLTPVSGSSQKAMRTTPGRCVRRRRRA